MPIIKSSIKRMRQTGVRRARNAALKRELKETVKAFSAKPTSQSLSKAQSMLDKAVKKNVLNINTASRRKAKLSATAKSAGVKLTAAAKKKPVAAKTAPKKAVAKKPAVKKPTPKKTPAKKPATAKAKK